MNTELDIILRLRDEMSAAGANVRSQFLQNFSAMQRSTEQVDAAVKNVATTLGALQGASAAANREVSRLKQELNGASDAANRLRLSEELGHATIGAAALNAELARVKKNIDEVVGPSGPSFAQKFVADAASVAAGIATFQVAYGAVRSVIGGTIGFINESIEAWGKQEAATMRVSAALRAQRVDVDNVLPSYARMASALQSQTTYADEDLMAMQALLVQVGNVMPSQMERALKASTNLAAGLGIDLETATRLVAKAAAGHTETLGRYGIVVSQAELATKGFSAVLEQVEQHFGGQAQAAAESYAGRVKQLQNTWNDLQETIGKFIVQNPLVIKAMNDVEAKIRDINKAGSDADQSWGGAIDRTVGRYTLMVPVLADLTRELAEYVAAKETEAQLENMITAAIARRQNLPAEMLAAPAPDTASNWQAVLSEMDKAKAVANDVDVAIVRLSEGEKQAALAAFQHGLSVQEATQALRAYWPDIDKSKIALEHLHKEFEDGKTAAKEHAREIAAAAKVIAKAVAEAASAFVPLTKEQATEAATLLKLNVSHEVIAKSIHATVTQVNEYSKALTLNEHIHEETIKLALEHEKKWTEEIKKQLDQRNKDTVDAYNNLRKLNQEYADGIAKTELSSFDNRRRQAIIWAQDQQDILNQSSTKGSAIWQQEWDRILEIVKQRLEAVGLDEKAFFDKQKTFTVEGSKDVLQLADAFSRLGQTIGGAFGAGITGSAEFLRLLHAFNTKTYTIDAEGNVSFTRGLSGSSLAYGTAGLAAGAVAQAMGTPTSTSGIVAQSTLQGAAAGSAGGPYGTAGGAVVGLIVGIVRANQEWRKLTADIQRDYGNIHISEDLAKAIDTIEDQTGLQRAQATLTQLDKIIQEAGGLNASNFSTFFQHLHDGFSYLQVGEMSVVQMTQVLDKNFAEFARVGTDAYGRVNAQVRELIRLNDQFGTHSQAITQFLQGQAGNAIGGVNAIAAGILDPATLKAFDQFKADVDQARQSGTGLEESLHRQADAAHAAAGGLADIGLQAVGSFAAGVASGKSEAEMLAALHPTLASLQQAYTDLGLSVDDPALKTLLLRDRVTQAAPQMIAAIGGLSAEMVALDNMGLLNKQTFEAMQRSGVTLYQRLFDQVRNVMGADADLDEVNRQTLSQMQTYLHNAAHEAELLGEPLDENTQRMIDQSHKLGIWKDDAQKAEDQMKDLITAVRDLVDALRGIPPHVNTNIDVTRTYTDVGNPNNPAFTSPRVVDDGSTFAAATGGFVTPFGIQHFTTATMPRRYFATGGPVGTDTVNAWLTPGEVVLTPDQLHTLVVTLLQRAGYTVGDQILRALASAAGYAQGTSITNTRALAFLNSSAARTAADSVAGLPLTAAITKKIDDLFTTFSAQQQQQLRADYAIAKREAGFTASFESFIKQQGEFYNTLKEGDARLKTVFYANDLAKFNAAMAGQTSITTTTPTWKWTPPMVNGVPQVNARDITGPEDIHKMAVAALEKAGFAGSTQNLLALAAAAGYAQGSSWDVHRVTAFLQSPEALAAIKQVVTATQDQVTTARQTTTTAPTWTWHPPMVNGVPQVDARNIIGPDEIHKLAVAALLKGGFAADDKNLLALASAAGYTQGTSWDRARVASFLTSDAALAAVKGIQHFATGGRVGTDTVSAMLTPGEVVLSIAQRDAAAHWIAAAQALMVTITRMPKVLDDVWRAQPPSSTWLTTPPSPAPGVVDDRGKATGIHIPAPVEQHFHFSPTIKAYDTANVKEAMDSEIFPAFLEHVRRNERQAGSELVEALPINWEKL